VWLSSFVPQTERRTGGGWFENGSGEVNVCPLTHWSLVMKRSEMVILIEMYKFCIRG